MVNYSVRLLTPSKYLLGLLCINFIIKLIILSKKKGQILLTRMKRTSLRPGGTLLLHRTSEVRNKPKEYDTLWRRMNWSWVSTDLMNFDLYKVIFQKKVITF